MSDIAKHILEIVLVVIGMCALIFIVQALTKVNNENDLGADGNGMVVKKIDNTLDAVFDKTNGALEKEPNNGGNGGGE